MSLDIDLIENGERVFSANITHNLTEMASELGIYDIVWRPEENGIDSAGLLVGPLVNAISEMKDDPIRYKIYDSPNGWGTYDGFLPWLERLLVACRTHSNATIECDR